MIDLTDGIEESDKKESANRFLGNTLVKQKQISEQRAKAEAVALSCGLTSAQ